MRSRLWIGVAVLLLGSATPTAADWLYVPVPPKTWDGVVQCAARNDGIVPQTIWVEFVEATNDGTVENRGPCVDLAPDQTCTLMTRDQRARTGRCRVAWSGAKGSVNAVVYSAGDPAVAWERASREPRRR
jgi:hypothetical protein